MEEYQLVDCDVGAVMEEYQLVDYDVGVGSKRKPDDYVICGAILYKYPVLPHETKV